MAGARFLTGLNKDLDRFDTIRKSFVKCSGFHTLESSLDWIKKLDHDNSWDEHWWPSIRSIVHMCTHVYTCNICILKHSFNTHVIHMYTHTYLYRPGVTKMCFLSALWHGVAEQREQYVAVVVNLATLSALFMGGESCHTYAIRHLTHE